MRQQEEPGRPPARPPEPPEIERRLEFPPGRWLGVGVLALIPVLALLDVFGERRANADDASAALAMQVDYPARMRYGSTGTLTVRVRNRSAQALDTIVVAFDSAYVGGFTDVTFTPAASHAYQVELTDVAAGETRLVAVQLQAERYGRHEGTIAARAGSAGSVAVRVQRTIFP